MYKPEPIDTSDVVLPEELIALSDKIAENVHDVWAAGRISQGWTYGEKRDDDKKPRPVLSRIPSLRRAKRIMTATPLLRQ